MQEIFNRTKFVSIGMCKVKFYNYDGSHNVKTMKNTRINIDAIETIYQDNDNKIVIFTQNRQYKTELSSTAFDNVLGQVSLSI